MQTAFCRFCLRVFIEFWIIVFGIIMSDESREPPESGISDNTTPIVVGEEADEPRLEVNKRLTLEATDDAGKDPDVTAKRKRGHSQDGGPKGKHQWSGYKIPKKSDRKELVTDVLVGFTDSEPEEEESDTDSVRTSCHSGVWTPAQSDVTRSSASRRNIALQGFYDPLAKAQDTNGLDEGQWAFLTKFLADPGYIPEALASIEEDCPAPEEVKTWLDRPIDPDILDIMRKSSLAWTKNTDGAFRSVSARLTVALGPLLAAWSDIREGQAEECISEKTVAGVCKKIEQTLIGIGQAHSAVLYQRRVNVLARFFKDRQKAADLVKRNEHVF